MRILNLAALVAITLPASAHAYTAIQVKDGGVIAGQIRYLGKVPTPKKIKVTQDPKVCGTTRFPVAEIQVDKAKGLKNAVVFIQNIKKGAATRPGKAKLANVDCSYKPHVQAFVVGTELAVSNADPVLHNTHIKLPRSDVFNYGLPRKGQIITSKIRRKGLMKVGCDAGHTWMRAWVAVFDHPYFAVTGADGSYRIADVPPGTYKLAFWHEKLGRKVQTVTVAAKIEAKASVDFK